MQEHTHEPLSFLSGGEPNGASNVEDPLTEVPGAIYEQAFVKRGFGGICRDRANHLFGIAAKACHTSLCSVKAGPVHGGGSPALTVSNTN